MNKVKAEIIRLKAQTIALKQNREDLVRELAEIDKKFGGVK